MDGKEGPNLLPCTLHEATLVRRKVRVELVDQSSSVLEASSLWRKDTSDVAIILISTLFER